MNKSNFSRLLCGLLLTGIPAPAWAIEFPLEFRTLTAQESMNLAGGYGISGRLESVKPAGLVKEPPAVSKLPLYGNLGRSTNGFLFRLDESQGNGKGYDRLIVDLNRNGDLTDDAAVSPAPQPESAGKRAADAPEIAWFGPIPAPESSSIGGHRPVYYARMYHFKRPLGSSSDKNPYRGNLRLRAGWLLQTTVELRGTRRKIALVDGDSNLRLGDCSAPVLNTSSKEWYFQGGDYFLDDLDGTGRFERSVTNDNSIPFGPILYFGAVPWKVALAAAGKSLKFEAWTNPLAELALQPHGEQVNALSLAWEASPGNWQLLSPGIEKGNARVPPGNYRLISCQLKVTTASNEVLLVGGVKYSLGDPLKVDVGAPIPFKCGAPLEMQVKCEASGTGAGPASSASDSFWSRLTGHIFDSPSEQRLIQAWVVGAGEERYQDFTILGKQKLRQPESPTFTITCAGKEVASGKLEYG
jgi:hypothetical protein